ncbi:hypothetical protein [Falsibacillus albus]|uniref:Uncharacterized protein n=1 Tax=Falsibacillus albus TaxID=2478915 RepID=A0A3L7KB94_9BACI|nr:hypothetical protein [Falsibacillus albus]RLQ97942.1 hypothetical protein D9X91_00690 [Falsibacillus albus]
MIHFRFDQRLGIEVPILINDWDDHSMEEKKEITFMWEKIRGRIPDRISRLDQEMEELQLLLSEEEDFARSCKINEEIAERASIVNDLWIWYRTTPSIHSLN